MLVIAHRGASAELPENTLPAFERAIEVGADYVELDVHADPSGRLLVTHDRPAANRAYPTLEEALDLMHGRIGVMVELKTPHRYAGHSVVARTVRLLAEDDVLVCFQRPALVEARSMRPSLRTVQHVGFGVSIRGARGACGRLDTCAHGGDGTERVTCELDRLYALVCRAVFETKVNRRPICRGWT